MSTRRNQEDREQAILDEIDRRRTPSMRQADAAIRGDRRYVAAEHDDDVDDEESQAYGDDEPRASSASKRQAARATRYSRRSS